MWRLGGVRNQFRFDADSQEFSLLHGVRRLPNGNLLLFDNGGGISFSRAVEYQLDEVARTATLLWSYRPNPDIHAPFLGFAQRLSNGNTLVTFGPKGTLREVTPGSDVLWELTLPPGLWIYRASDPFSLRSFALLDFARRRLHPKWPRWTI